jgi:poly(A) polymerase
MRADNQPMESALTPRQLAFQICRVLQDRHYEAFLVGGCVRDEKLHRNPVDYDVTTGATPTLIQQLFPDSLMVGALFGVVIVRQLDVHVEVATFRTDVGYSDGRHPDHVVFGTSVQEDVRRRDFTINGLLKDPLADPPDGKIIDFVGGLDDIEAGIIRTIGEPRLRFTEDKLRLIRAVRFAARFGYEIEPQTFAAIKELAPQINQVSAERLRDELTKILTEGAARRGFELLDETGLLQILLPEVARMKGVQQPPEYHPEGDVWIHTLMLLENLPARSSPTLAWGALLHDVGKPPTFQPASKTGDRIRFNEHAEIGARMAEEICKRFRFSNEDTDQIVELVATHMRFKDVQQMKASTLKRFVRSPKFEEKLELHRLDCLACHRMLDNYRFVEKFIAETPPEQVRPDRLITGEDLQALGFRPGPLYKQILQAVEDAQLEGKLTTKEDAVLYVKAEYGKKLEKSAG